MANMVMQWPTFSIKVMLYLPGGGGGGGSGVGGGDRGGGGIGGGDGGGGGGRNTETEMAEHHTLAGLGAFCAPYPEESFVWSKF
jgi:hypothetical protein